jgi:hypothetical protein
MLFRFLKSFAQRALGRGSTCAEDDFPAQRLNRLKRAHARAPTRDHLDILYRDLRIGMTGIVELVERCLAESSSTSPPLKAFHRPLASYFLAQYFLHSLNVDGERAECGVASGISALLMCHTAQMRDAAYCGAGLHLIDSFQGLSAPGNEDHYAIPDVDGKIASGALPQGWLSVPIERTRAALRAFPQVQFHCGWIPDAFASLPEAQWSFVHIDVDLYEPTYASLEYFYPRLPRGGVIICDDYGAPLFPGAHRAWDSYCDEHDVPYVVLDTGQSVILKG